MTASKDLKTPCMTAPLAQPKSANPSPTAPGSKAAAHAIARRLQRLKLDELLASDNAVEVK